MLAGSTARLPRSLVVTMWSGANPWAVWWYNDKSARVPACLEPICCAPALIALFTPPPGGSGAGPFKLCTELNLSSNPSSARLFPDCQPTPIVIAIRPEKTTREVHIRVNSLKGEFTGARGHRRLPHICTYERELPVKVERLYENEHPPILAQIQFRPNGMLVIGPVGISRLGLAGAAQKKWPGPRLPISS